MLQQIGVLSISENGCSAMILRMSAAKTHISLGNCCLAGVEYINHHLTPEILSCYLKSLKQDNKKEI